MMKKHFIHLKILMKIHHHWMEERKKNGKWKWKNIFSQHFDFKSFWTEQSRYSYMLEWAQNRAPKTPLWKNTSLLIRSSNCFLAVSFSAFVFYSQPYRCQMQNYEISQLSIQKPNLSTKKERKEAGERKINSHEKFMRRWRGRVVDWGEGAGFQWNDR